MRKRRVIGGVFGLSAAVLLGGPLLAVDEISRARATINSCIDGSFVGNATLFEVPSSEGVKNVTIVLSARNLTEGKHAVHIHEVGACVPCSAAGSHLDLGPFGNNVPVTANHPHHSGDLINVRAGSTGSGFMTHVTSRVALSAGSLSIFDANGSSLIIHTFPDTYCADPTDPSCAGGGRVACGIIEPVQ